MQDIKRKKPSIINLREIMAYREEWAEKGRQLSRYIKHINLK